MKVGVAPRWNVPTRFARIAQAGVLARKLAEGHRHNWDPAFNLGAVPDFKNSTMVIAAVSQGGLGLPDRDYYVRDDSTARALRAAYLEYAARTLGLLGEAPAVADSEARRILALETALARASLTRVERRDPNANYHKLTLAAADSLTPHFAWASFLNETGAAASARHGGQPDRRPRRPAAHARVDERHYAPPGARQAARLRQEDRLPRQVAGLRQAGHRPRRSGRQRGARPDLQHRAHPESHRLTARSRRVAHDAAHRERDLQPVVQRHHLPRPDPSGAVLRSRGRRRGELRRHGRRDRPRDDARLRRSGPPVRRRRESARLVDPG